VPVDHIVRHTPIRPHTTTPEQRQDAASPGGLGKGGNGKAHSDYVLLPVDDEVRKNKGEALAAPYYIGWV
jgi:hypothetical protein